MKIERSKEWWVAQALREGTSEVGAGFSVLESQAEGRPAMQLEETRIAFGRFVNLMRRQRSWTFEKLADEASIDVGELMSIEDDCHYTPEVRTVYKLAQAFEVPQKRLMQLAGLVVVKDSSLREQAVRFAARSEPMHKLTREEKSALESFVAALSDEKGR
jgi:transcriptional regulator with XRE-family HTH domain